MTTHELLALLMLFVGLALLIAEVFIPSGGMITILSMICFAVSVWCAYTAWWEDRQIRWWSYMAALVLLLPASVGGALFALPRTRLGRYILLEGPSLENVTPYTLEEEHLRKLVGKRGRALTLLNPGGMVTVDGERLHCECQGMLVEPGEDIEVVGVKGNRLVVRLATGSAEEQSTQDETTQEPPDGAAASDDLLAEADRPHDPPLDFEVPHS